mgnify:FL=1
MAMSIYKLICHYSVGHVLDFYQFPYSLMIYLKARKSKAPKNDFRHYSIRSIDWTMYLSVRQLFIGYSLMLIIYRGI